jgi:hypothetical protein
MQLLAEVGAGYVWAKDVWCVDRNLQRFLDFPAYYFRRLSVDHKATLRKYAAFNQWDKASALLHELNIIHWKEYSEQLL